MIELKRVENGHWYYVDNEDFPGGKDLVSVTTFLDVIPSPGLRFWWENTDPETIKRKQDEGKRQGSKVHHCSYLLSQGEKLSSDGLTKNQIKKLPLLSEDDALADKDLLSYLRQPFTKREKDCLKGLMNFWNDFNPLPLEKEITVYSKKYEYAGTLDLIAKLKAPKAKRETLFVVDYKTSVSHDLNYERQLACYVRALKEMRKNKQYKMAILYLGKPTKKRYQFKIIDSYRESLAGALRAKQEWHCRFPNAKPIVLNNFTEEYQVKIRKK